MYASLDVSELNDLDPVNCFVLKTLFAVNTVHGHVVDMWCTIRVYVSLTLLGGCHMGHFLSSNSVANGPFWNRFS